MQKTAELFYDHGHQAIRLPEDIHFDTDHVAIRQDVRTGNVVLSAPVEPKSTGDFERLFQMLDELGPAPEEFMIGVSDPLLEREIEDLFGDDDDLR